MCIIPESNERITVMMVSGPCKNCAYIRGYTAYLWNIGNNVGLPPLVLAIIYIYTDAALTVIATPGSINCSRFSHIFSWSFFFCYALLEKETERDRERSKNHHFIRSNERRIRGYVARSLRTSEEEHRESKRGARCIG